MRPRNLTVEEFDQLKANRQRGTVVVGVEGHAGDAMRKHDSVGMRTTAKNRQQPSSDTAPPPTKYRNKWELNFANKCELDKRAGLIKDYTYENLTFKLAHRQYHRNDFLIWHLDNSIEIAQVKGKWHKNMRAGIKGLKWAAQLNPWFTWTLKTWTGSGWYSHYVEV